MADNEVSKLTWIAIVVALAASIYSIAKPQINNLTNATFDKISSVTSGIRVSEIKHMAYANNAEGTDGFSTTKPNLNLLKNTRTLTATSNTSVWGTLFASSQIYDSVIKSKSGVSAMNFSFDVHVPLNATVGSTSPIQLKGQNSQATNVGSDEWNTLIAWRTDYVIKQSDLGKTIRVTAPVEKGPNYKSFDDALANTASIIIRQSSDTPGFVYSDIKLEPGSIATPYMPSASEVKPSDQPKYIGTYTDHSETASQDPKNYTWTLNPDYKA